ncbi:nuclease-related domain-containing protein [[Kitasatospora] papulosa]|uniref:nuclease-related domain-containing protein n=1 Tax=[Kitasatospora] papulosa TaxID=1464011 RepID=UPI0036BE70F5
MRRAEAVAARWERGAAGEAATARLLRCLDGPWWLSRPVRARGRGWRVRHDLRLAGRRFNVDHVLVSPCGTAVVVADTKSWHRGRPTALVDGRVHCGDDRHDQVEAVARYARLVEAALNLPGVAVVPLIVVHGSPVVPGGLEAPVSGGTVWVLGAGEVVRRLREAVQTLPDRHRAQALDARVKAVLSPYR